MRFLAAWTLALVCAARAWAGGGPENVFLVVNSASWASQTVANHYIKLRHIPACNIHYVDWTGGFESTDVETFRTQLLLPILDVIEKRGLLGQIDYVIYSSDFPYHVNLLADHPSVQFSDQARPDCSITSATYLWNLLLTKIPLIMDVHINLYMRRPDLRGKEDASHGFRSWYGWGPNGEFLEAGGQPYMLSTMLAMTSGRGNSVREAISYLERSATADGTFPKGVIYFSKTDDVRSKARSEEFAEAVEDLDKLDVRGRVISTVLPANRPDVMGLMTGAATFNWPGSHCKILPGAICEDFTSFGGVLAENSPQTPLTEFLRYGAAGSCGTVTEPYAIGMKFPSPQIQVHYARGCSLAEAFYQGVWGPAQLLIVGDPLCRPWANIPRVQVGGDKPVDKVSGALAVKAVAKTPKPGTIDRYEMFIDGRRMTHDRTGTAMSWDSKSEGDGYHELRVVAVESGPIETQGRAIVPLLVNNDGHTVSVSTKPEKSVRYGENLVVHAKSEGASRILVVHNGRVLGQVKGAEGDVSVNTRALGTGPVTLQALAQPSGGGRAVSSVPISLEIEHPTPLPPIKDAPAKLVAGLSLKLPKGDMKAIDNTSDPAWIALAGLNPSQQFTAEGIFEVPADDMYQFQMWHYGSLKLTVDSTVLYNGADGNYSQKFAPVSLAAGKHRLVLSGTTGSQVRMRVVFGGPGALNLNGQQFKHAGK